MGTLESAVRGMARSIEDVVSVEDDAPVEWYDIGKCYMVRAWVRVEDPETSGNKSVDEDVMSAIRSALTAAGCDQEYSLEELSQCEEDREYIRTAYVVAALNLAGDQLPSRSAMAEAKHLLGKAFRDGSAPRPEEVSALRHNHPDLVKAYALREAGTAEMVGDEASRATWMAAIAEHTCRCKQPAHRLTSPGEAVCETCGGEIDLPARAPNTHGPRCRCGEPGYCTTVRGDWVCEECGGKLQLSVPDEYLHDLGVLIECRLHSLVLDLRRQAYAETKAANGDYRKLGAAKAFEASAKAAEEVLIRLICQLAPED